MRREQKGQKTDKRMMSTVREGRSQQFHNGKLLTQSKFYRNCVEIKLNELFQIIKSKKETNKEEEKKIKQKRKRVEKS